MEIKQIVKKFDEGFAENKQMTREKENHEQLKSSQQKITFWLMETILSNFDPSMVGNSNISKKT